MDHGDSYAWMLGHPGQRLAGFWQINRAGYELLRREYAGLDLSQQRRV